MTAEERQAAAREALGSERILVKTGESVVTATLRGVERIELWTHYPKGDVFDPESGAQWYYHCHAPVPNSREHGHFHCFLRPRGARGPVHHLVAVGVDAHGRLLRLFTVNRWVVGDDWLGAEETIALLPRFRADIDRPSFVVNRWLGAILRLFADDIAELIRARDARIAAHKPANGGEAREDHALEVTSELLCDLPSTAKLLEAS